MFYLFQTTFYAALLYTVYLLILKNKASHSWNRLYLLTCAVLPPALPFIKIPALNNGLPVSGSALNILLPAVNIFSATNASASTIGHNWSYGIAIAYALISVGICCWIVVQYILFMRFVKQNGYEIKSGVTVLLNTHAGPGSFHNYMFMPGNEVDPVIFEHELAHIRLKHSWDILFIRVLQIIFWPDIMLYFILRELKMIHEFQADAYAVSNKESYVHTLLNNTFSSNQFSLSHTFFYHPLKRRIMMLQRSPLSSTKLRITIAKTGLATAILLSGIIYLQSCKEKTPPPAPSTSQSKLTMYDTVSMNKSSITGHREIYSTADIMPHAEYDVAKFMQENMRYPEEARKQQKEGRVLVKFAVDETGNIILPEIIKSPDELLSSEALRVVRLMPAWKPGETKGKKIAVYFSLPLSFKLSND